MRRFLGFMVVGVGLACSSGSGDGPMGGSPAGGSGGAPVAGRGGGPAAGAPGSGDAGMGSAGAGGAPGNAVSYRLDIKPIFEAKCFACHFAGSPTKLDLARPFDPVIGLVNRPNSWTMARNLVLVVPGEPDKSALMDKIAATDLDHDKDGDPMPYIVPPATAEEIEAVRTWITNGAENDDFFAANVAPLFGDAKSLGANVGKCSFCHAPGSGVLPDLVNPFDPQKGVVNVRAALGGGVRVVPGDPEQSRLFQKIGGAPLPAGAGEAMPLRYDRLTAAEIEKVRTWIREGARDN